MRLDQWSIDVAQIESHPGFSPVKVSYDNAVNVVGTHTPEETKGRSLILKRPRGCGTDRARGHVDTHPPFEPWIEGDWLYGRGGADMKAGLCANLAALDALETLGWQPAARVPSAVCNGRRVHR